jgi:hypothetical protein
LSYSPGASTSFISFIFSCSALAAMVPLVAS